MELTKISVLKLTLVSVCAAMICLASIALLGVSLHEYWKYKDTKDVLDGRMIQLQQEVEQLEIDATEKRSCVEKIDVEYMRYVALTNQSALAENQKHVVESQISAKTDELKKLNGDMIADRVRFDAMSEKIQNAEEALKKLKEEIAVIEKRKVALSDIEAKLPWKRQEIGGLDATIAEKEKKLASVSDNLKTLKDSFVAVQTNLALTIERTTGIDKIIGLKKETISSMDQQIATMEERKKTLSAELAEVEKELRIQLPKKDKLIRLLAEKAGEYIAATNSIEAAKENVRKAESQVNEAKGDYEKSLQAKRVAEADVEIAKQKCKNAEVEFNSITNRILQIKAEIGEAEETRNKMNVEIAELNAKEKALTQRIQSKIKIEERLTDDNSEKK